MSLAIKARKILNLFRTRDFQYPTNDSNNEYSTDKSCVYSKTMDSEMYESLEMP